VSESILDDDSIDESLINSENSNTLNTSSADQVKCKKYPKFDSHTCLTPPIKEIDLNIVLSDITGVNNNNQIKNTKKDSDNKDFENGYDEFIKSVSKENMNNEYLLQRSQSVE